MSGNVFKIVSKKSSCHFKIEKDVEMCFFFAIKGKASLMVQYPVK